MLRPRSMVLVMTAGLGAWLTVAFLTSGRDLATLQLNLGIQLAELGFPAAGSFLIERASEAYRVRARKTTQSEVVRWAARQVGLCEAQLGDLFRKRNMWSPARCHYQLAAHARSDWMTESVCWMAYVDGMAGQTGERRTLLGVLVDDPNNALAARLVGLLFLKDGQSVEARQYLEKSIAAGDQSYEARVALTQIYRDSGDMQLAQEHARQALQLATTPAEKRAAATLLASVGGPGPHPLVVWISTFWARHRSGLLTIAIILVVILAPTWLGLVSRLSPSTGSLIYSLLRSSEPAAIQTYERALQRHPNNIRLIRALADAYRRLGVGATRAAELWERLYELCPTDREVRDRVVQMTLESGRETDIALHACQIWFVEYPDHPDAQAVAAHLARFYCSRRLTAPESALPALRRAAEAAPADQDLHAYVAALNLHYGHGAQAIAMLNALVEGNPENEMLRQQLAQALISTGDAYQAYRHLRILSPSPEVTTDLYLAGVVAQSAGRYRESLRILQEVMRRDPALFDIQERVAEVSAHAMLHHYGQFEIVETIAGQEASVLYGARHPNYGDVLLVVFRRDFSDTLGFPTAFTEQLPLLQSPVDGCADLLDFGNEEEEYFVAYALPRGRPLSTVMQEKGLQEAHKAGEITLSILEALQSLHTRQRLHGDLRPSAIWLDEIQGVTLVGAGLSMLADTDSSPQPPTARSAFHTSPEVIERHELSAASDLYAVGCILYELLVGSPPLEGPTQLATLMAHVTINPEPPSMKAPNVPPEMDHLVLQALAKDPAVRPPSAKAFAEELRKVLQTLQPPLAEPTAEPEHNVPPLPGTPAATRILLEPPDPLRWWTYYADLSLIATGRFTKVYRGVYRQTGELHAIKHLQVPRALNEAEGLRGIRAAQAVWRLFQGEIHLLQSLTEKTTIPGLIRMLQIYREDENSPAYAMPLMHRTLGERIATEGPLTFQEAMRVIQELGTTVEALHEREIVHRSITPRSVMFDAEGQVHLGGFDGACRLVDRTPFLLAEREIQQTSPSPLSLFGDIRFLAPERCRGDEFDTSTDVYSLGALLFFMLAGKAPFEHPDELQIMLHHVSTPPPRLYEVDVAVPTYIQEVLDRALAKSPAERYQTAGALVNALTSHLVTRG